LNARQLIIEPGFLQVCQFDALDVTMFRGEKLQDGVHTDKARSADDQSGVHQLLSGGDALKAYTKLTATKNSRRNSAASRKQFARATMSRHSLTSVNSL
jgi:hypothetical protein